MNIVKEKFVNTSNVDEAVKIIKGLFDGSIHPKELKNITIKYEEKISNAPDDMLRMLKSYQIVPFETKRRTTRLHFFDQSLNERVCLKITDNGSKCYIRRATSKGQFATEFTSRDMGYELRNKNEAYLKLLKYCLTRRSTERIISEIKMAKQAYSESFK